MLPPALDKEAQATPGCNYRGITGSVMCDGCAAS